MSRQRKDRGLRAVRRVRAVRERDSRIGLQQALSITRKRQEEVEAARIRLESSAPFVNGTAAAYQLHVLLQTGRARELVESEEQLSTSRTVAEEATQRWIQDRQSVRVAELLIERREAERLAEEDRRAAQQLDELAGQAWLRDQQAEHSEATSPKEPGL